MASKTTIEWTESTWNPVSGCTPCSPGCLHCYAADMARRFPQSHGGTEHVGTPDCYTTLPVPFSRVICHEDRLDQPLHWRKPRVVFVPSMGDLFHEGVPTDFIADVLTTVRRTPQHTYLLLTKRPERQREFFQHYGGLDATGNANAWGNLWLGVSVSNQAEADEKAPIVLDTPAAHRFLSVEPMLEAVDLRQGEGLYADYLWSGPPAIDAVIIGCESGSQRRPTPHAWIRELVQQCDVAGVPVMVKQMATDEDGSGELRKGCPVLPWLGERRASLPWMG